MRISHHGQGGILFAHSEPSKRLVASEATKAQDAASWEAVPAGGPNANGHRQGQGPVASTEERQTWQGGERRCGNKCNVVGFTSLEILLREPKRTQCFANDIEVVSFQSLRRNAVNFAAQQTEKIKCCGLQTKQLARQECQTAKSLRSRFVP